ncbi:inositol-1-monophosphatase [Pleionea mediterranea]|uniref:Inositol-1-monophosphatase n=1 Tax=Pleionea mediterranea TaxID=523701 RepID=A0A316FMQ1_9GAMM|nr:inositol-1-monophosphatase [Pleionea mediterranea]PWK50004.1 myo-inositol-1(or 4)-monophosphatase [Pleionea mediterranea]
MHPLQTIAVRAARAASDTIMRATENLDKVKADVKGRNDFVTDVDQAAERRIIETIQKTHPDHAFLAEESGESSNNSDVQWIIDPLDGTTNFLRGMPHFSVSIAAQVKGKLEVAVVYDPVREELFTASRGSGAQLNGKRIRVSQARNLEQTLLATGFPFRSEKQFDEYMTLFGRLYPKCGDMRRAGSAALDLAYVAAGRFDGFWEFGLKWWDIAAGSLLVSEAGGMISDFKGNPSFRTSDSLLAANPKIFKAMLSHMRSK